METIDLRSDTVTWPTPAMRTAMANADVGDDVYGDDPTVNQLEADAATMFGKEAALFVTSGTQGNLTAVLAHCGRGSEIILGKMAHIFRSEAGSAAAFGGIQPNTLPVQADGTLELDEIQAAIRADDEHYPRTKLICLENTQAMAGGVPLTAEYITEVGKLAHTNNLKLHIDGARIFNAAAALNVPASELTAAADSVTFCLSKGLCAPAGSVLVGSREFIAEARRARKALGGGLRQAGILAAAGLIGLHEMTKRLSEDHDNACLLAEGLATLPYVELDPANVKTNMIYFKLDLSAASLSMPELVDRLKSEYNIIIGGHYRTPPNVRLLTHYWITRDRVEQVISAFRTLLK